MSKLKVLTVVGTRPEIIRLSRVISALDVHTEHVLVHTGQNYDYELNQIFFDDLEIRKPDHFLEAAGETAALTIGNTVGRIDAVLESVKPEAFLVLGDTNSCLSAIAAKRRRIPIFHMEAGNRCFDERVPEEINRKIVDHISDINLPYSDISREYLLKEGLPADRIIKTGSPMFEVLMHYQKKIQASSILTTLKLAKSKYILLSAHREENIDSPQNLKLLGTLLEKLSSKFKMPILFSTHPRTRNRLTQERIQVPDSVILHKPFGFCDYIMLQQSAFIVLSDSGTISEESSILGFPAINIREAHERPEAMEEAQVILSGLDPKHVLQCIDLELSLGERKRTVLHTVRDYMVPNVSEKVLRIILSYTPYIRRTVWAS